MTYEQPCIVGGCFEYSTNKGRCKTHQLKAFTGNYRKERLPDDWAQRREFVLHRDKRICYLCGGEGADTVDHVEVGDNHSMSNLKAVHDRVAPYCHKTKTAQEGNDARRNQQTKQWGSSWAEEYQRRKEENK